MNKFPPRIIFINGPPHSGKDTAAGFLRMEYMHAPYYAVTAKMSAPLKDAVHALHRAKRTPAQVENDGDKDKSISDFGNRVPRDEYINLSERYVKFLYGHEFFGEVMVRFIDDTERLSKLIIISDTGFQPECVPIIRRFEADHCFLIRLHREGCDFGKDSRSYIELDDPIVATADVENKFDLTLFRVQVIRKVERWLQG